MRGLLKFDFYFADSAAFREHVVEIAGQATRGQRSMSIGKS